MNSYIKKAYQYAEAYFVQNADFRTINKMMAENKRPNSTPSSVIKHQAKLMRVEDLASWKMAIMLATSPENPNKSKLAALYYNMLLDNHLGSVIETRIAKTQQSPFKLIDKNKERVDVNELLETIWFQDFLALVLKSKFQGTTLIELFETNDKGELGLVTEIEQSNFNPIKGIIQAEPGDEKGTSYKEGPLANYYIQVGKDYNDLGLYSLVAPIVIAKKLGLGSWLDFIEKYGVPPLFITTEREDDNRLMELFEMATNFKRNAFMIGRGNEKFEIPSTSNSNSQEAFDGLIKRADNEVSKRFLGGTGLTDEKGFVGSVEIQFELANFRFNSDKLLVRHIINDKLIPLLVKLSPVYAPLDGLTFVWDDEEGMTIEKMCEVISKLGNYFDFDPEQVEQITGLKILGIKQNGVSGVPTEDPKKKMT